MPVRPTAPATILAVCAVLLTAGLISLSWEMTSARSRAPAKEEPYGAKTSAARKGRIVSASAGDASLSEAPRAQGRAPDRKPTTQTQSARFVPEPTPFPVRNATLRHRFDGSPDLAGFDLNNVAVDGEGLALSAPASPGTPRVGTVESPPLVIDVQSNSMQPKWKAKLPDGADVTVALSLSPDGKTWTPWQEVQPADQQPEQFREDGSTNYDYGFTVGNLVTNGTTLYGWIKWKVTMNSSNAANPVLRNFCVWYDDSTGGRGKLATPPPALSPEVPAGPAAPTGPSPTPISALWKSWLPDRNVSPHGREGWQTAAIEQRIKPDPELHTRKESAHA